MTAGSAAAFFGHSLTSFYRLFMIPTEGSNSEYRKHGWIQTDHLDTTSHASELCDYVHNDPSRAVGYMDTITTYFRWSQ